MEPQNALYMIPVPISEGPIEAVIPGATLSLVKDIKYFIVENVRTARRCLKKMNKGIDISGITFYELNEHTNPVEISGYLEPLRKGEPMGVMSEAGCPGVADPGADVVRIAQKEGLKVVPLVGPSSILLALMASGLNGQHFAFHGYLPVDNKYRDKTIRDLENQSRRSDMTQIFIETPYRNSRMMESLVNVLSKDTLLCVGANVTDPVEERIETKSVGQWIREGWSLEKVPTIFLFYAV